MIPEVEGFEDRLLGMNTIIPDSDGAFCNGFSRRWSSWDYFQEQFDLFSANTYQRFPVRSTTSVEKRNKQIRSSKHLREVQRKADSVEGDGPLKSAEVNKSDADADGSSTIQQPDETEDSVGTVTSAMIPSSWKVYSKTLKYTYGIKQK